MIDGETDRLIAWGAELRRVHGRLRDALRVTRAALAEGSATDVATRELLLFCPGFCAALTVHHRGEDSDLFPALVAQRPELRETVRKLVQDHSMIAHLVTQLEQAVSFAAPPAALEHHLDGIAAIMESHFRYEERQLLRILDDLDLHLDPAVLGSL